MKAFKPRQIAGVKKTIVRRVDYKLRSEKESVVELVLMLEFATFYHRKIRSKFPHIEHTAAAAHMRSALTYLHKVQRAVIPDAEEWARINMKFIGQPRIRMSSKPWKNSPATVPTLGKLRKHPLLCALGGNK